MSIPRHSLAHTTPCYNRDDCPHFETTGGTFKIPTGYFLQTSSGCAMKTANILPYDEGEVTWEGQVYKYAQYDHSAAKDNVVAYGPGYRVTPSRCKSQTACSYDSANARICLGWICLGFKPPQEPDRSCSKALP